MKEKLQKIREEAVRQIEEAKELNALNDVRVSVLGKKGELTAVLKGMKDVKPEDRPMVGQLVNETREAIERTLEETKKKLESAELEHRLEKEVIDVTLPAKQNSVGHRHPNMIALEEVERIFVGMGYEVVEGPEVEQDYYNFEALNIPKNHPARDEQDTFYINDSIVLRTQTSPVQVRVMEEGKLPIRMIAPGRVFRSDEVDATHSPSFHQIEGLVIDKNITFADLKGTLEEFAKELSEMPKVCPHFHLSLQSGCDATLKRMNRKYTSGEYYDRCQILRKYFDHPALTTDVIVGFPGETEEEFEASYAFVDRVDFYETHIFKYSKREGTKAAVMDGQIDEKIKGERSARMIALGERKKKAYEDSFIGKEVEVLFEERAQIEGKAVMTGHTKEYMKIALETEKNISNCIVKVRIENHSQIIR